MPEWGFENHEVRAHFRSIYQPAAELKNKKHAFLPARTGTHVIDFKTGKLAQGMDFSEMNTPCQVCIQTSPLVLLTLSIPATTPFTL